jgi:hypothetical protein
MTEDSRCCGSGTCIIDTAGRCWCGQQWDGEKMGPAPMAQGDSLAPSPEAMDRKTPDGHGHA